MARTFQATSVDGLIGCAAIGGAACENPRLALKRYATEQMLEAPYRLDRHTAGTVLKAIREVCITRDWQLVAAHVRSTHVHCVVDNLARPNRAIADFKAYSSRALNTLEGHRKRWARVGSTRRLQTTTAIYAAVRYVADGQGDAMALWMSSESPPSRTGL